MQIKSTKSTQNKKLLENAPVVTLPNNRKIVFSVDTKDLLKANGLNYYSLYRGTLAYFFDAPATRLKDCIEVICEGKSYCLTIVEFIYDLIFWKANVVFNMKITEKEMYDYSHPNKNLFSGILDNVAKKLIESNKSVSKEICDCVASIKTNLSTFAQNYSCVKCNTISVYNILQFKNRNKEFKDLFNTRLDKTKTIAETEQYMKNAERKLANAISADKDNCLNPYVKAGRLNMAQLTKFLVAVGTRPDIDKTILPWPIERSYLRGLQNAAEYFMETITARDAMMTKNDNLPRSGFLSREINRLTSDIYINYDVEDCGSKITIPYEVKNSDYLKMVNGKYMVDDNGKEHMIDSEKDSKFIGKTIQVRSFITCNCKNGVCKKCVGNVEKRLRDTRLGSLPSIKCINPMSQKSLSAKHDLGTKSISIKNETLLKYFYSDGTDFFIKPEYSTRSDLYVVVRSDTIEDLLYADVDVDDDSIDTLIALDFVAIRDHDVDYEISNEGLRLALSDEVLRNKKCFKEGEDSDSELTFIPINKLDLEDSPVFNAILDTEEISKYLSNLIGTIDRNSISRYTNLNELLQMIMQIIYESGFVDNFIHFECIVKSMLRDINDCTRAPDWSDPEVKYQILKISTAIMNKDLYTAISYQGLKNLFKTVSVRKRMGTSLYDSFFKISKLY